MPDFLADFARWTVAAEMLLLLGALVAVIALDEPLARRTPRAWWWAAASVAVIHVGITVAVVLNALIGGPQTPGVKLLAPLGGLAVLLALVAVRLATRRPPAAEVHEAHVVANARVLGQAIGHLEHLDPCHNPDCQRIRAELRALAGHDER